MNISCSIRICIKRIAFHLLSALANQQQQQCPKILLFKSYNKLRNCIKRDTLYLGQMLRTGQCYIKDLTIISCNEPLDELLNIFEIKQILYIHVSTKIFLYVCLFPCKIKLQFTSKDCHQMIFCVQIHANLATNYFMTRINNKVFAITAKFSICFLFQQSREIKYKLKHNNF